MMNRQRCPIKGFIIVLFFLFSTSFFSCVKDEKKTIIYNTSSGFKKITNYRERLDSVSLLFEKKAFDLKKIRNNRAVSIPFVFKNISKTPLLIFDIQTSCGCTVPEWSKEKIKPSGKGEIKIIYDAKQLGHFSKTISVFYNGKNSPQVLIIKGEVMSSKSEDGTNI